MIALRILDIKKLTAALLIGNVFDDYALMEAQITTFCTFQIDGRIERDFYGSEDEDAPPKDDRIGCVRWRMVKERCFDLIKGKRTPLSFRFVLFYPPEKTDAFLERDDITIRPDILNGLCINLRYDGDNLLLTTGTSMKTFTADRSCDLAWDREVLRLITSLGAETEQLS